MKTLIPKDKVLINLAKKLIHKRFSNTSCVAAALRTTDNKIFTGINIDIRPSPSAICAEYAAMASMTTHGNHKVEIIVAVYYDGKKQYKILPPCGQCRQLISSYGQPDIIIEKNSRPVKINIKKLLPEAYISLNHQYNNT